MMRELVGRVIPRLSDNERLVLGLPFEQLDMLGGEPGITVDKHWKVPSLTVKSLRSRNIAKGNICPHTRIMPLTRFGAMVAEALRAETRKAVGRLPLRTCEKGHVLTEDNLQRVGVAGERCRTCRNEMHKRIRQAA
jgi:hypothetical protein